MGRLTSAEKEQIEAHLRSLDYSGMSYQLSYSIVHHFKSYVGRDYKTLAQLALHILTPYMTPNEKMVWLALSKVSYFLKDSTITFVAFVIVHRCLRSLIANNSN